MNYLDIILAALFLASTLLGAFSGLINIATRFIGLGAAVYLSFFHYQPAAAVVGQATGANSTASIIIAITVITIICLLASRLLASLLGTIKRLGGLTFIDYLLGAMFGLLRAYILTALLIIASVYLPDDLTAKAWSQSHILRLTSWTLEETSQNSHAPAALRKFLAQYKFSANHQPQLSANKGLSLDWDSKFFGLSEISEANKLISDLENYEPTSSAIIHDDEIGSLANKPFNLADIINKFTLDLAWEE